MQPRGRRETAPPAGNPTRVAGPAGIAVAPGRLAGVLLTRRGGLRLSAALEVELALTVGCRVTVEGFVYQCRGIEQRGLALITVAGSPAHRTRAFARPERSGGRAILRGRGAGENV
jgi:hypothetical protein